MDYHSTLVDLSFPVTGDSIPVDHAYFLYAALSRMIPEIHDSNDMGIFNITGTHDNNRRQRLTTGSRLTLRVPKENLASFLPLGGQHLAIGDQTIKISDMHTITELKPARDLYSRLVIIKGYMEPEPFLEALTKQLEQLEIMADVALVAQPMIAAFNQDRKQGTKSPFLRRTLNVKNQTIVGFAVSAHVVGEKDSIRLQETGLGGRRKFGCGLFIERR